MDGLGLTWNMTWQMMRNVVNIWNIVVMESWQRAGLESEETKCSFIVVTPSYITPGVTFMHTKEICGAGEKAFIVNFQVLKVWQSFIFCDWYIRGRQFNGIAMILENFCFQ